MRGGRLKEKRTHKRIVKRFIVRVGFISAAGGLGWDIVTVHNLSAGGILFSCDRSMAVGARLNFKITLPNSANLIQSSGKVIRLEKPQGLLLVPSVAAQFTNISSADGELIDQFAELWGFKAPLL